LSRCLFKKQQYEKVTNKGVSRTTNPFQLLHHGLCGPLNCPSLFGDMYFLTFVNDYNKKTWVFFFKKKSGALDKFKYFKRFVERKPMVESSV
jgi:hypothetical protein